MAHPQTWQCVGPSHWKRGLSSMEAYFSLIGNSTVSPFGRETGVGSSCVQIAGDISAATLKETWKRIRFYHPGLATTIEDGAMHYRVPTEEELEAWVEETFVLGAGNFEDFFPKLKPVRNVTMYWLPDSSELIVRSSHWKGDGIGSLLFWNEFLSSIGRSDPIEWGKEVENLAPTADALWNRLPNKRYKEAAEALEIWAANVPGVGPPSKVGKALPGGCRYSTFVFSEQETRNIVSNRKFGLTPDAHAAFALANAEHQDRSCPSNVYATFGSFSLRHHVDKAFPGLSTATNLYYISLPMVMPLTNFEDMSKELKYQYKDYNNRLIGQRRDEVLSIADALFEKSQSPAFFQGPVSRDALFSNVGVVEKFLKTKHGDIEILDLKIGMDIIAGLSILSVYTFKGKLRLTYSYNEGYQKPEDIQMLLCSTARILKENCSASEKNRSYRPSQHDVEPASIHLRSKL